MKGITMKSVITVIREQIENFYLIRRISLYELKSQNKNNYLGMAWELINPAIQIIIYWFVFGTIRQRAPIDMEGTEVSFFPWLLAGYFLWVFCQKSITKGSKAIFTRLRMLSKMNFPMSAIPSYVIFSNFYVHLLLLAISIVIFQFLGYFVSIYYLQFLYFIIAAFCLLFALSLITSTLSTLYRDFDMFLNSVIRMLLYLSGVLWPVTLLSDFPLIMKLMMMNPIFYLLEGYRSAFFGTGWYFIEHWQYSLYFWGLVLVLLLIGSALHVKFRRNFIDYI